MLWRVEMIASHETCVIPDLLMASFIQVSLLLKESFIDSFPGRDQPFMKVSLEHLLFFFFFLLLLLLLLLIILLVVKI